MKNRLFKCLLIFTFLAQSGHGETQAIQNALSRCVSILAYDENDTLMARGSGVIWDEKTIITNYHVISGATRIRFTRIGNKEEKIISEVSLSLTQGFDLAALTPAESLSKGIFELSNEVIIGEELFVVGNPQGFEGSVSKGIVSAFRDIKGLQFIQMDAPISAGSSGGAVINSVGKLIGIATSTWSAGQNINFAITVLELQNFLRGERSSSWPTSYIPKRTEEPQAVRTSRWLTIEDVEINSSLLTISLLNTGKAQIANGALKIKLYDQKGRSVYNGSEVAPVIDSNGLGVVVIILNEQTAKLFGSPDWRWQKAWGSLFSEKPKRGVISWEFIVDSHHWKKIGVPKGAFGAIWEWQRDGKEPPNFINSLLADIKKEQMKRISIEFVSFSELYKK